MSEEIEDWLTAIEKAVEKGFDPSLNETQITDLQKQIDDIRNILTRSYRKSSTYSQIFWMGLKRYIPLVNTSLYMSEELENRIAILEEQFKNAYDPLQPEVDDTQIQKQVSDLQKQVSDLQKLVKDLQKQITHIEYELQMHFYWM